MRQCSRALVAGGMRTTLRGATQSEQRVESAAGSSVTRGAGDQLESAESVAPSLYAAAGAPAPAQQGDGSHRAGAVWFYLGAFAQAKLLPGRTRFGLRKAVRVEQTNEQGGLPAQRKHIVE